MSNVPYVTPGLGDIFDEDGLPTCCTPDNPCVDIDDPRWYDGSDFDGYERECAAVRPPSSNGKRPS
jgi:hypothetical protein